MSRVCDTCGEPLTLRSPSGGYVHASGRDSHEPVPVRRQGVHQPSMVQVSHGHKRPSGQAAMFTRGDGR